MCLKLRRKPCEEKHSNKEVEVLRPPSWGSEFWWPCLLLAGLVWSEQLGCGICVVFSIKDLGSVRGMFKAVLLLLWM